MISPIKFRECDAKESVKFESSESIEMIEQVRFQADEVAITEAEK